MIVKKLYRKVKCSEYDAERRAFENVTTTDYIGWFLFGCIPIYLIELDKETKFNSVETGEFTVGYAVNKKYKHLMVKGE